MSELLHSCLGIERLFLASKTCGKVPGYVVADPKSPSKKTKLFVIADPSPLAIKKLWSDRRNMSFEEIIDSIGYEI